MAWAHIMYVASLSSATVDSQQDQNCLVEDKACCEDRDCTAKTFGILQPYFRLSELHQCGQGTEEAPQDTNLIKEGRFSTKHFHIVNIP